MKGVKIFAVSAVVVALSAASIVSFAGNPGQDSEHKGDA